MVIPSMCHVILRAEFEVGLGFRVIPRGSYPTPFLGYLVLWLGSAILKSWRPKIEVRYEPLGNRVQGEMKLYCAGHVVGDIVCSTIQFCSIPVAAIELTPTLCTFKAKQTLRMHGVSASDSLHP